MSGTDISFDGYASFHAWMVLANIALAGITYLPDDDWNGNDTLYVAVDDRGFSAEVRGVKTEAYYMP